MLPTYLLPLGSGRNRSWKFTVSCFLERRGGGWRGGLWERRKGRIQQVSTTMKGRLCEWVTVCLTANVSCRWHLWLHRYRSACRIVAFTINVGTTRPSPFHFPSLPVSPSHTNTRTRTSLLFIVHSKQERLPAAHFRKNKQLKQSNTRAALLSPSQRAAAKWVNSTVSVTCDSNQTLTCWTVEGLRFLFSESTSKCNESTKGKSYAEQHIL